MNNKMQQVAELLGIELNQPFQCRDAYSRHPMTAAQYKLSRYGMLYYSEYMGQWVPANEVLLSLLTGDAEIVPLEEKHAG